MTPAVVSERLKVNGSVARASIRHLEEKGLIHHVGEKHHVLSIDTRKITAGDDAAADAPAAKAKAKFGVVRAVTAELVFC